jgi:glycosyltransferase involved in cell wall biosynthesis
MSLRLVTVYIPTHNRLALLQRAIESVQKQSYQQIELIVVDDGSTDKTQVYLKKMQLDGKLVYLRNETAMGACHARNRALEVAKGEFITGLDDDDALQPERITRLVKLFMQGNYSCVTSSIAEYTGQGLIGRPYETGVITLDKLLHHNLLGNQVLTNTSNLRDIGGFDEKMPAFQDYDTWVRLLERFGPAYKLPQLDYIWYTDHESERISQSSEKRLRALQRFEKKHAGLMNASHRKSMRLMRYKLTADGFTVLSLFSTVNWQNKKSALLLYMNQNLPALKRYLNSLRVKARE